MIVQRLVSGSDLPKPWVNIGDEDDEVAREGGNNTPCCEHDKATVVTKLPDSFFFFNYFKL